MPNKPLSKKEVKARAAEANAKVNKKRDFRQFANKMFKDPTAHLPMKTAGLGDGSRAYCYDCGCIASKISIRSDRTKCLTCGNTNVEFRTRTPNILDKIIWRYKEFCYGRQYKK